MKKILIGSTALQKYVPGIREPKDLDYAVDTEGPSGTAGVEFLYNPVLFEFEKEDTISAENLLNLKISHLFFDINWDKHMFDVQQLLKLGNKIDEYKIDKLFNFFEGYLPKVRMSNLDMSKEDFFTNAVNYDVCEHDQLHEVLTPTPAYKKLLRDGCEVELDPNKWLNLTFEEKCDVVFEETAVMAFERFKGDTYYKADFQKMLKKCIIQHFPRYIALFAIENYVLLMNPKINYKQQIKDGLQKIK